MSNQLSFAQLSAWQSKEQLPKHSAVQLHQRCTAEPFFPLLKPSITKTKPAPINTLFLLPKSKWLPARSIQAVFQITPCTNESHLFAQGPNTWAAGQDAGLTSHPRAAGWRAGRNFIPTSRNSHCHTNASTRSQ